MRSRSPVQGGAGGLEEFAHAAGQRFEPDRRLSDGGGRALQNQVVSQHDAVALLDRANLVVAIGVEGDERELPVGAANTQLLVVVLDHHRATREPRGQVHDQRADHVFRLLEVLVRYEELAGRVDQQVVQFRLEASALWQSAIAAYPLELRQERLLPAALVELDPAFGDLPGVAHAGVQA